MPGNDSSPSRATVDARYQRDWATYFELVRTQPPRDTCVRALDLFEVEPGEWPRLAIDIGCGEGRDTREILRRKSGWSVLAMDGTEEAVRQFSGGEGGGEGRVRFVKMSMEDVAGRLSEIGGYLDQLEGVVPSANRGSIGRVSLINASFALPFCDERSFDGLWRAIVAMLRPGGRFAGQFFGDRDEWAAINPKRHRTRGEVLELLQPFEVEWFDEVEKDGSDAMGGVKHHHLFHVVARKRVGAAPRGDWA